MLTYIYTILSINIKLIVEYAMEYSYLRSCWQLDKDIFKILLVMYTARRKLA